jgi:hypothetical protein
VDYEQVPHGHVAIATQLLGQPPAKAKAKAKAEAVPELAYPWDEHVPPPGRDATLLAVVPIPGTQTSLAIVAYAISTDSPPQPRPAASTPAPALASGPATGLLIDHEQRRVWIDGAEVTLTFQEFELLAFLSAHPATVFSRADLLEHVWSGEDDPDRQNIRRGSRTVDVHVSRLRRKLGPRHGQCLVTEHRAGYQFRPPAR